MTQRLREYLVRGYVVHDHQCLTRPQGSSECYVLGYDECRRLIDSMSFGSESELFGREKDDSFRGALGNIYQSFGGVDIYPTMEEKLPACYILR